ncbi:squalene--hopene cyclase [bacterium]|nr:squalene--hopene cyclase [bacterium]
MARRPTIHGSRGAAKTIMHNSLIHIAIIGVISVAACPQIKGQALEIRSGDPVPRDVRDMYDRGLTFLSRTQASDGGWQSQQQGTGVAGMAVMCFMASGEDPNFGMYAGNIRRAIRYIIGKQDKTTGYLGGSMYHHGFACLGLAEAYGAVDDRRLWDGIPNAANRSIGQSLELAVRSSITAQKTNTYGAWRYNPSGSDADTSVAGAVLMGLLAARNAGIEVPDDAIDRAISYFIKMTAASGQVAYSGGVGGFNESLARISIANLVFSIARRKDIPQFKTTLGYLKDKMQGGSPGHGGVEYQSYYQAQAFFQADIAAWTNWNKTLVRRLKTSQAEDGSFSGTHGPHVSTSLCLLGLAVNYRFLPIYER